MKSIPRTIFAIFIFIICLHFNQQYAVHAQAQASAEDEVRQVSRLRNDTSNKGDRATWERYTADEYIRVDEGGNVLTRAQVGERIAGWAKNPQPDLMPDAKDVKVSVSGNTAVVSFEFYDIEPSGPTLFKARMKRTEHYVRRDGRWQANVIIFTNVYEDHRKAVKIDSRIYDRYVGEYEWAPGIVQKVWREGDVLMSRFGNEAAEQGFALNETTFFIKSDQGVVEFVIDKTGAVTHYIYRRPDGQELIAKKIK